MILSIVASVLSIGCAKEVTVISAISGGIVFCKVICLMLFEIRKKMKNHVTVNNEAENVEPDNEAENAKTEANIEAENEENDLLIEPDSK